MIPGLALVIVLGTTLGAIRFGRQGGSSGRRDGRVNLADWAVGGRRFGTVLFWFMNAGEVYTTLAVLGISGYAFALGAPAYLAFTSVSLSYVVGYWLMPRIWRAGRAHGLITQPDFFAARFGAPWLGVVTALVGILALVMYVQVQLVSLSLIVQLTMGSAVSTPVAVILAAVLMVAFVLLAGLRSAAVSAAVKDVLMIVVVVLLSVTVAHKVGAASLLDVFRRAEAAHPGIGRFPGLDPQSPTTSVWLMTLALNVALGNWAFPHLFQICYSARSATAIRRNAIWQPLYSLAYFFIILLGFAALLAGTSPSGGNSNAALLQFVADQYPPWVIGLVAGTGCLLALAPGGVLLLTAGSIFTRNVLGLYVLQLTDRAALRAGRAGIAAFAAVAVWLTIGSTRSLVTILRDAYSAIGMLAPSVFLAFRWHRTTAMGVLAGIVAGIVALLAPFATDFWTTRLPEWEPGLLAMAVNLVVVVGVSLVTPRPPEAAVRVGLALGAADLPPVAAGQGDDGRGD